MGLSDAGQNATVGPAASLPNPNKNINHASGLKGSQEDSPRWPDVAAPAVCLAVVLPPQNELITHTLRPKSSQENFPRRPATIAFGTAALLPTPK